MPTMTSWPTRWSGLSAAKVPVTHWLYAAGPPPAVGPALVVLAVGVAAPDPVGVALAETAGPVEVDALEVVPPIVELTPVVEPPVAVVPVHPPASRAVSAIAVAIARGRVRAGIPQP